MAQVYQVVVAGLAEGDGRWRVPDTRPGLSGEGKVWTGKLVLLIATFGLIDVGGADKSINL